MALLDVMDTLLMEELFNLHKEITKPKNYTFGPNGEVECDVDEAPAMAMISRIESLVTDSTKPLAAGDFTANTVPVKFPKNKNAPKTYKSPGTVKKVKKPSRPTHLPYPAMISTAIADLKQRGGSSRQAILKYILANNKLGDEKKAACCAKLAIREMLADNTIIQVKGSFKLAKVKKP
ncbi:unnamed protein product, partial [Meganyctiphanes norvegica]|uniref:H15 domain-containing protein n=1 Tax=Meganyctiphanes norvegica TaxID=48144 RepID=A0AAV2QNI0_MEGNR